jgi:hypothetical protein
MKSGNLYGKINSSLLDHGLVGRYIPRRRRIEAMLHRLVTCGGRRILEELAN